METGSSAQDGYVQSPNQQQQQQQPQELQDLSPTLADILSDDRILRFYQCVKDIKTQRSPEQTAAMFFALCHALGDAVSFVKIPPMPKIMFRQEQQLFAVNVAGTQHDTMQLFQQHPPNDQNTTQSNNISQPQLVAGITSGLMHDVGSAHTSNLFSAAAADSSPQHLLQAALASVNVDHHQLSQQVASQRPAPAATTTSKRKTNENKDGTPKRAKKASPRDKEYAVRRNEVIQDLLKVSEADLLHQANIVENDVKLIIKGHERSTKFGVLAPLHRFAAFANLPAHYDCDFAPKNAGVYFNYEYFQLYLAYRDLEAERQQQQQMEGGDPRPILAQCRADIEKVLVSTNWEAIRRRLTIGERICQVCGVVGRGFLLLSKQVSGRKLLHNFNTGEWGEFMREFQRPETQPLLQTLQTKYSPERFYGPRQDLMVTPGTSHNAGLVETMVSSTAPLTAPTPVPATTTHTTDSTGNNDKPTAVSNIVPHTEIGSSPADSPAEHSVAAVAAAVAAAVGSPNPTPPSTTTADQTEAAKATEENK